MAHYDNRLDGKLAFSVARVADITGNPMHDIGSQCSDARPYFKFVSGSTAYYTTLHPKHATTAKTVSVYTKGSQREGCDTMQYLGSGSQTGGSLAYNGVTYTCSGYEHEWIRVFAVNRWAKYKPFRNAAVSFASQSACDTARANAFQGFDSTKLCREMTPGSDGRFPHLVYEYLPPRAGNASEWCRMLDFACLEGMGSGYYHGAKPPIAVRFVDQPFRKDWAFFVTFLANPTGESGYDMYNCLSVDDLYNNSAANGAYGYCPSLIMQDLETNEFIVVSSGVTLSSINKTNGVAVVAFVPEDMPFFTTVNRIGHEFEVISCLAQLDATNGPALVGEGATVYYGQEHVLYGARSLEFTEGFGRKTITLEDKPPKNYDGVSISVEAFTVAKKSGASIMGDSWTDFYISSDIVIDWETDDRYDNTNFPVQICFLSSSSGLPIINGGQAVNGLYKTVTVLASKKNSSGATTIYASELLNVTLSAPTTMSRITLIVKAVVDNPDTEIGQTQITAQNTYTLTL